MFDRSLMGGDGGEVGVNGGEEDEERKKKSEPSGSEWQSPLKNHVESSMETESSLAGSLTPKHQHDVCEFDLTYRIGVALQWEDTRIDQIDMIEGNDDFNNIDVDSLPKCTLELPTLEALEILGSVA
jgi:hypothetical protein